VRLKTIKLKNQYSAGLLVPLSALPGGREYAEGDDVAEILRISKYEAPIPAQLHGEASGGFPTQYIPKTDELNFRSWPEAIEELKESRFDDAQFIATLKLDGTSTTYLVDVNRNFLACSRNYTLERSNNTIWRLAENLNIESSLMSYPRRLALQGEVYGEGIQKNTAKIKGQNFAVFLARDLDSGEWLDWDSTMKFCQDHNIAHVPEVVRCSRGACLDFEHWQTLANNACYEAGSMAEGLVVRSIKPIYSRIMQKFWWSVKVMNQAYDAAK
jgi:RNA ligase (TIGR02306 family)